MTPQAVRFSYDGRTVQGLQGDTIATALYANGVRTFSRSFKYHRPRGLYGYRGLGAELLMEVDAEPNVRGDCCLVREGMVVRSQNAWPSNQLDLMAINDVVVPWLPNQFYYKMFHRPRWLWPLAEKLIRRAAGLGRVDRKGVTGEPRYEKRYRFPDVCVVGGGVAGLAATRAALQEGKRVLLIESELELGGQSRHTFRRIERCPDAELNGLPEYQGMSKLIRELEAWDNLEILRATDVFGVYDDGLVAARRGNDLFKIRSGAVVLAPGATDRHLVFQNNDKPGIMTGRGVERLIGLRGIKPGRRAVVVTTHDSAYHTARTLIGAGVEVVAVADSRPNPSDDRYAHELRRAGVPIFQGETVHAAHGWRQVRKVTLGTLDGGERRRKLRCDLLVVAMGIQPQLGLLSMGKAKPAWDAERGVFRIENLPAGVYAAGEVNGAARFARIYAEGWAAGKAAAVGTRVADSVRDPDESILAPPPDIECGGKKHFICRCMDVTRSEACASIAEGFDQVETLKRYTSMGMGPCQGKSCYEAVARLAALDTGVPAAEALPTTMRPPYLSVPFGVLSGRSHHLRSARRTAMHHEHQRLGATWLDAGTWRRPARYSSALDEARHVRESLGMIDVSTLGKVEISGPDALDFLHFLLPGLYRKLAVGRTRYTTMVTEEGILFEDGTLSHLEAGRYYLTTTTGNQDRILGHFWWWITQRRFEVHLRNLGPVYAAVNVSGPRSRDFLQTLVDTSLATEDFPYMACRAATIEGVPLWMFRIGFTGEMGYEIHYPSELGASLWRYLLERGEPFGMRPVGIEAQRMLRLEKGHLLPGWDTDPTTYPFEAGVGFTVKAAKDDFVGAAMLRRRLASPTRTKLITYRLAGGAPLPEPGVAVFGESRLIGRVTSSELSPAYGHGTGMAWVTETFALPGSTLEIRTRAGISITATVLEHALYDPEGERLRA